MSEALQPPVELEPQIAELEAKAELLLESPDHVSTNIERLIPLQPGLRLHLRAQSRTDYRHPGRYLPGNYTGLYLDRIDETVTEDTPVVDEQGHHNCPVQVEFSCIFNPAVGEKTANYTGICVVDPRLVLMELPTDRAELTEIIEVLTPLVNKISVYELDNDRYGFTTEEAGGLRIVEAINRLLGSGLIHSRKIRNFDREDGWVSLRSNDFAGDLNHLPKPIKADLPLVEIEFCQADTSHIYSLDHSGHREIKTVPSHPYERSKAFAHNVEFDDDGTPMFWNVDGKAMAKFEAEERAQGRYEITHAKLEPLIKVIGALPLTT